MRTIVGDKKSPVKKIMKAGTAEREEARLRGNESEVFVRNYNTLREVILMPPALRFLHPGFGVS